MTIALEGSPQELLVPRLPYLCMHKQNFVIVHTLKPLNSNSTLARLDTKWQLEHRSSSYLDFGESNDATRKF